MPVITHQLSLRPFTVPDRVYHDSPARPRQEGFGTGSMTFLIAELPVETLDALCQEFRAGVFRLAMKRDPKIPDPECFDPRG